MVRKILANISLMALIMFAYQNCGQQPLNDIPDPLTDYPTPPNNENLVGPQNPSEPSSQNQIESDSDTLLFKSGKSAQNLSAEAYNVKGSTLMGIDLNLENGNLYIAYGSKNSDYCVNFDKIHELKLLIDSSEICRKQPSVPPGQVCSMAFKIPYAIITYQDENQALLGSATDGCGSNGVDLCSSQRKQQLVALLDDIYSHLDQYNCQ